MNCACKHLNKWNSVVTKLQFRLRHQHAEAATAWHHHHHQQQQHHHQISLADEAFWAEQADKLQWFRKWDQVCDHSNPPFTRWFPGGTMNTCFNAVDRHVDAGFGNQPALFYDSPLSQTKKTFTYQQLQKEVTKLAAALRQQGVRKGDVVLIYMPMVPQAIFAMLAASRIGAIHSLVFGGFAATQLASRIAHAKPKLIVTSTFGLEPNREIAYLPLVQDALRQASYKPQSILVYQRPEVSERRYDQDVDHLRQDGHHLVEYSEVTEANANTTCDAVPISATDPVYVLYTSGTTGAPKAPVRPSGGHAVALNWSMEGIYGVEPGEPWAATSDLGWVVGHSYICYGPLLHRNPTLLYEGKPVGTPDAGAIFRLIEEYKLVSIFSSPTALRAIKKEDPEGKAAEAYNIDTLRSVFVAGEHLDPSTLVWARERFGGRPVIDHWWQTESGWAITATSVTPGQQKIQLPPLSSAGRAAPGWNVEVLRPDMTKCEPNELGTIAVKMPLPPGALSTLYEADQRFVDTYYKHFPGYYNTTDAGYMDAEGHIFVMGRIDDVINVAGHRLSTGSLEEAIQLVPEVAEAAVVGREDALKGHVPFAFCTLKSNSAAGDFKHIQSKSETAEDADKKEITDKIKSAVRKHVGAIASLSGGVLIVKRLPKTRSGKVARNTLAAMVNKKPFDIPVTIEDAMVYPEIADFLKTEFNVSCHLPDYLTASYAKNREL